MTSYPTPVNRGDKREFRNDFNQVNKMINTSNDLMPVLTLRTFAFSSFTTTRHGLSLQYAVFLLPYNAISADKWLATKNTQSTAKVKTKGHEVFSVFQNFRTMRKTPSRCITECWSWQTARTDTITAPVVNGVF